jgi:hypothetical protein
MYSFFSNSNIDYLSPQLYTTGKEPENDFAIGGGVNWDSYSSSTAAIVPGIAQADYYDDAVFNLAQYVAALEGFGLALESRGRDERISMVMNRFTLLLSPKVIY